MLKRIRWMLMGAGLGIGTSFWLVRTVRQKVQRFAPRRVGGDVAGSVRGLGTDVRAAVAEGRLAMREREAQLQAEFDRGAGRDR